MPIEGEAFPFELPRPKCTQKTRGICLLLQHLTAYNKVLWDLCLQLREDSRDEPGHLSVATVYLPLHADMRGIRQQNKKGARPVTLADRANYDVLNSDVLVETLMRSSSLRRLTIIGRANDPPQVLQQVGRTEGRSLAYQDYMICTARIEIPVLLLEKHDATLVSLDLENLLMSPSTAKKLIESLIKNDTVEQLAVGYIILTSGPATDGTMDLFAQYLGKGNSTLRELTFGVHHLENGVSESMTIARAVCAATTLEELTWQISTANHSYAPVLAALARSRSLRSLTFLPGGRDNYENGPLPRENASQPSWISALKENTTLEKLDLDVSWSYIADCCLLLEALAEDKGLQSVTLRNFPNDAGSQEVLRAMRERGLDQKVRVECYPVFLGDHLTLPACNRVTSIVVRPDYLTPVDSSLRNAFHLITTSHHITSVYVFLDFFHEATFTLLATYISESPTIKQIELKLLFCDLEESFVANGEAALRSITNLFMALSSNEGITSMLLYLGINVADEHCQLLADAPSNNRQLHELSVVSMGEFNTAVFLDRLLPGLELNYNLLILNFPFSSEPNGRMCEAQELVRRNCSLVDRATRFVMGDRSWYCACAFERVSEEPVLLNNVRRKGTASEEAEDMIRRARMLVRFMNVHDYMSLTGVVKARVECYVREDGRPQLDELYDDCWLRIRRYLTIEDVIKP
ncbi:hypothetical protein HPB52_005949 [Rhipicephalus sanguineus]|uniref:Uncharacterized protein n=1 Tax=Rhipicephalus sanguineus TaxID=34632 RepID=A0A9D4PJD1_RHISA|nr:hypothetical protein HPB52_005949 [Rhipicephalus sanguineus]